MVSDTVRWYIITVSDRASRGEQPDLSGPRASELVREWYRTIGGEAVITSDIVSDDRAEIRAVLERAIGSEVDVIITTGGTGLGPRDVTPDVSEDLLEQHLPGVMERIRTKYGARNPRALLSRGAAGSCGSTLLFNLPGSVKAVEEYLEEILPLVGHALDMLHGGGH